MLNKHAIWLPGQGSQHIGMGRSLSERYSVVNDTMDEASEVLGMRLDNLMYHGPLPELTRTDNAQPAILALSIAMYRIYSEEWGYTPTMAAGHSLGEITALTCAGSITFPDALRLVRRRGELMQEAAAGGAGTMAAVKGLHPDIVARTCSEIRAEQAEQGYIVVVSNINSDLQTVISGHTQAVHLASAKLTAQGAVLIPLLVSAAFHSPLMEPAASEFAELLSSITFKEMKFPVVSALTGVPYHDSTEIADRLARGLTEPVNWPAVLAYQRQLGANDAVELGPGRVLTGLAPAEALRVFTFEHLEDETKRAAVIKHNSPYSIDILHRCLAIATCVRNRNWNVAEYEQGVVMPYRGVQQLIERMNETGDSLEEKHVQQALAMLESVFRTKGASIEEQKRRLLRLKEEFGIQELVNTSNPSFLVTV
ncbi:[acyl-carrier-protein] S-malonyltransferase [Paenibacillus shirakamiensis]|uniref:[acyl-carrier-protein] S-malonyltransferase n=1 Tax=Paenibacillus shirakamiensis TaxID=1265935 RepID=A0ABS4JEA2_9BACL|nr:ACP S-malonyltransferase [Paenibacillus shirakamiensis]MBP2000044.1 [acyl-carrier-protein] S-malonyltransferase [Paenibacillus shirakamiensis]